MTAFAFIIKYLQKTKALAGMILAALIISSISNRAEIYAMSQIIGLLPEYSQNPNVLTSIILYIALLGAFLLLTSLSTLTWRYFSGSFMPYFSSLVYKDIFIAVHHHSLTFFNEEMAGKITAKAKNVVSGIREIYGQIVFGVIRPITGITTTMFLICINDIILGLIILVLHIIVLFLNILIRKKVGSFSEKRARFSSETDGVFTDTVTNSELVKSFANYFYEKGRFYRVLKTAVKAEQNERHKDSVYDWQGNIIFYSVYLLSCICIFYDWYLGRIDLAGIVMCVSLMQGLNREIINIGFFAGEFSQVYGQITDGLNLIFSPCVVQDCANAHSLNLKNKAIEYKNISFTYNKGNNVFKNFNLTVKDGERVGLVGHSGSGKSTLIKLLVRYYDVQNGQIIIGGENIKKVRQDSLRAKIAVIPQDTTLFNRTIMENIRYGNTNATDDEVIKAAKAAYADEFINKLPNGYASKVGERGVMLSGGERQRIAIARAILKNAPILILDEATSALDSESELYIQKSLKKLMKGKTVIAIAHRLSTLREMDRLIVMNNGKVLEEGSHDELLQKHGAYYDFYQLQQIGEPK
ncbi:MAG: ABC transporter ATP-binding protein [Alphaproteobacteria bacterium]|nr:ABC transporter ATP-binding protein [Alphaproteobacteria bacterium]